MPDPEPQRGGVATLPGFGWLCPTEEHRARMLDMGPRVRRARTVAMAAVAVGLLVTSGELGWSAVPLFAIGLLNLATLDRRIDRSRRPERVVAASLVLVIALMAAAAALTQGGVSPVLGLLAIPVAMTAARFRAPVVWSAAGVASLFALAAAVIGGPQKVIDHPVALTTVLVLLVGVTAVTTALMDAELQFRSESVLDSLTGLLNRTGLEARFAEVAEQARLLGRPVCLIMCDLDRFKSVNDAHGHEHGDTVLREVSYEMRKSLRSFELFYRIGGEEFLVLLPGVGLRQGVDIAQSMRAAVQRSRPGGLEITASLGVSVGTGEGIEFTALYRAADEALYSAKRAGHNVVVASGVDPPAAKESAPAQGEHAPLVHV